MARSVYMCNENDLTLPSCSECDYLEADVEKLKECCEEAKERLTDNEADIEELQNIVENLVNFRVEVVDELPEVGEEMVLYLVPKEGSGDEVHNEYLWVNGEYEKIGDTDVDLSGYVDIETYNNNMRTIAEVDNDQCERLSNLEECCDDVQSQLQNINNRFGDYYTKSQTYTQQEVNDLIANIEGTSYKEVDTLPATGETNVIYLVPNEQGGKDQWIYSDGNWVNIGSTSVALGDYLKISDAINMIHPVGDTIIRLDSTNPGALYQGTTWQKISEGKMLIGADSTYPLGSTGGSPDAVVVKHNHTQDTHNHSFGNVGGKAGRVLVTADGQNIAVSDTPRGNPSASGSNYNVYATGAYSKVGGIGEHPTTAATRAVNQPAGVDGTGKNMPPYLAVNIWIRTA